MKALCMGFVPVTALFHSADRPSLSLYCLLRVSDIIESGVYIYIYIYTRHLVAKNISAFEKVSK
jgi:hypothetical protein